MQQSFRIDGLEELGKVISGLPVRLEKQVLRKVARAGATVARKRIKAAAPAETGPRSAASKKYGTLKSNIKVKNLKQRHRSEFACKVTTGNAFWGSFSEFGTSHQPAKPWFRPAFDGSQSAAFQKMAEVAVSGVEAAAKTLAGKYAKAKKAYGVR